VNRTSFIALLCVLACESPDDLDPTEVDSEGEHPAWSGDFTDAERPSPIIWERSLPNAYARTVATDEHGRTYVAASSHDGADAEYLVLLAYDTEGDLLWQRSTPRYGAADDVALTVADGRIGVALAIRDVPEIDGGITAAWVYDEDGAELWAATTAYHDFFGQDCVGIDLVADDVVLSGQLEYTLGDADTHGFRVDAYAAGSTQPAWTWSHAIDFAGGCGDDVEVLADGSIIAAGRVSDTPWFTRIGSDGRVVWQGEAPLHDGYDVSIATGDDGLIYFHADGHVVVADADANVVDELRIEGIETRGDIAWNGESFAIATSAGVAIVDRDGTLERHFTDPDLRGRAAAWLPDGDVVLVGSSDSSEATSARVIRLRP
jgi:hypothetical protein